MRAVAAILVAVAVSLTAEPAGHLVQIDVSAVNARGQAVLDLKPGDFQLREEGATQAVDGVRLVRGEPRLVAVFLDEYHVDASATSRVREALTRFVDQDLAPTDLLVVMKPLDSILTIRLTTDGGEAHRAIEAFEGRKGDYEPRNPYEREFMAGTPPRIESARIQVALSAINALTLQ